MAQLFLTHAPCPLPYLLQRTVFCLQLANRLTNGELAEFFTANDCRVRSAKIVTDRNSGRSKGVRSGASKA